MSVECDVAVAVGSVGGGEGVAIATSGLKEKNSRPTTILSTSFLASRNARDIFKGAAALHARDDGTLTDALTSENGPDVELVGLIGEHPSEALVKCTSENSASEGLDT